MRRSMLFLPGNAPKMIINGNFLGSDAVIFDLEDAVAPDQKDAARILVRNVLKNIEFDLVETIVRINSIDTAYWQKDIDAILPQKPDIIMLPKTGTAADVMAVDAYLTQEEEKLGYAKNTVRLMPLIETALGVENAYAIASASDRVVALFLGERDHSKFHLNQALVIWLFGLLSVIPCVGFIIGIAAFILAIMGFISALNGEEKALPIVGGIKLLK